MGFPQKEDDHRDKNNPSGRSPPRRREEIQRESQEEDQQNIPTAADRRERQMHYSQLQDKNVATRTRRRREVQLGGVLSINKDSHKIKKSALPQPQGAYDPSSNSGRQQGISSSSPTVPVSISVSVSVPPRPPIPVLSSITPLYRPSLPDPHINLRSSDDWIWKPELIGLPPLPYPVRLPVFETPSLDDPASFARFLATSLSHKDPLIQRAATNFMQRHSMRPHSNNPAPSNPNLIVSTQPQLQSSFVEDGNSVIPNILVSPQTQSSSSFHLHDPAVLQIPDNRNINMEEGNPITTRPHSNPAPNPNLVISPPPSFFSPNPPMVRSLHHNPVLHSDNTNVVAGNFLTTTATTTPSLPNFVSPDQTPFTFIPTPFFDPSIHMDPQGTAIRPYIVDSDSDEEDDKTNG